MCIRDRLYVLAAPTVTLIYNAPKAELATQITAFSIFFLGVHQVTTGILQGLNRPRIPVINMGISLIIKVILNWTLTAIPWLGIGGAAWATVADIGFAALLNLIYIKKYTGYFLDISLLWKNVVSAGVMGILIFLSYHYLTDILPMWANFIPVSYTHLDVYKRQLQGYPIVLTFGLLLANHLYPYQIRALDPLG